MECKTIKSERQRHGKHSKLPNKKTYLLLGIKQTTSYKPLILVLTREVNQLDTFKLKGMQN